MGLGCIALGVLVLTTDADPLFLAPGWVLPGLGLVCLSILSKVWLLASRGRMKRRGPHVSRFCPPSPLWAISSSLHSCSSWFEALDRRADRSRAEAILRIGDLELDTLARTACRGGKAIELQRREFLLLEHLVRRAGEVVTRAQLLEAAWNYDFEAHDGIVGMHIHRLRRKIDGAFASRLIETVPGAGYMIRKSGPGAAG